MGRISSFETLEQRRLFAVAVDLRVTNVIVPPGMIGYSGEFGSNTDLSLEFDLQNVGTTVYSGSPHTLVSFSSDPSFDLDDPDADADVDGSVTLAPGETKRTTLHLTAAATGEADLFAEVTTAEGVGTNVRGLFSIGDSTANETASTSCCSPVGAMIHPADR